MHTTINSPSKKIFLLFILSIPIILQAQVLTGNVKIINSDSNTQFLKLNEQSLRISYTTPTYYIVDSIILNGNYVAKDSQTGYTITYFPIASKNNLKIKFKYNRRFLISTNASQGFITPSPQVLENTSYRITYNPLTSGGYTLDSVFIDGISMGTDSLTGFTFYNVTAPHSVRVVYKINQYRFQVQTSNGGSTNITDTLVNFNSNLNLNVQLNSGYHLDSILINNQILVPNIGVLSFSFLNINKNYSLFVYVSNTVLDTSYNNAISVVNGIISPTQFTILKGNKIQFKYLPNIGYTLDSVIVNGNTLIKDSVSSYTFDNFNNSNSLRVVFRKTNTTIINLNKSFKRSGFLDSLGQTVYFIDTTAPYVPSTGNITDFLNKNLWDTLFPFRANWTANITAWDWLSPNADITLDFYSFSNLIQALKNISGIKVLIETRCNTNYQRVTRFDLINRTNKVVLVFDEFIDPANANLAIDSEWVDYSQFISEGSVETRARELCAFLANASHETTGGWSTAPRGQFSWGLYFKSEVGIDTNSQNYSQIYKYYPPKPPMGYIGRGPLQLSYNFNYGLCSSMLFGDRAILDDTTNLLLNHPGWVIWNGVNAWMTAIWFWMTPQYPKPSCHDAMIPNKLKDTSNGYGIGATINIINGGVECNSGSSILEQVTDRLNFYQRFCNLFNVSFELYGGNNINNCNCSRLTPYNIQWGLPCALPTSKLNMQYPKIQYLGSASHLNELAKDWQWQHFNNYEAPFQLYNPSTY